MSLENARKAVLSILLRQLCLRCLVNDWNCAPERIATGAVAKLPGHFVGSVKLNLEVAAVALCHSRPQVSHALACHISDGCKTRDCKARRSLHRLRVLCRRKFIRFAKVTEFLKVGQHRADVL